MDVAPVAEADEAFQLIVLEATPAIGRGGIVVYIWFGELGLFAICDVGGE